MDDRAVLVPRGIGASNSGIASLPTPGELQSDARFGLLGKADQRKNGGRSATVVRGGEPKTVIDLRGDDQLADVVTVSLNVDVDPQSDSPSWGAMPPMVALLQWGTDGGTANAEVDVLRGQTFQVPASMLIVRVAIDALPELIFPPEVLRTAVVSGSVGYYPTGAGPAQRSRWGLLFPFGTPDLDRMIVDVPRYARRVRLVRAVAGAPMTVDQIGPAGPGFPMGQLSTLDPNASMPLGPTTTQVRVINNSAAAVVATLVFELAI